MNTINDRLALFILSTGKTKAEFALEAGWTRQYLQSIVSGASLGLVPVATLLRSFPDLNARWLILGEGDMLRSTEIKKQLKKMVDFM